MSTTISDDDAPTGIGLSVSPSSVDEDDDATSLTVTATLNGATRTSDTVVTIGTLAGSATKDTDYSVTSSLASVTIPANSSDGTGTLTINPTDDDVVEGVEIITISGTTTTQVGLSVNSAEITLNDRSSSQHGTNDSTELSIAGPTSNVSEGGNAVFTVTLSKEVAKEVTVAWSAPLPADAAEGADLSATSGTVTFAANSAAGATQSITITATDDALSEGAEGFTVTLGTISTTLPSDQVSLKSGESSATATIAESDPIAVSISGPERVNDGETATYTVSLSPTGVSPTANLTVSYATADDTAIAGSDYTAKSGTLTFTRAAAGPRTFTVQTTEDTDGEGDKTFTVSISNPSGGGGPAPSIGTSSVSTTITYLDQASPPPSGGPPIPVSPPESVDVTLKVSPGSLSENEGATSFTVTATLNADSALPADTVITIGSLDGTATLNADYSATSLASITIPANSESGTGTLTITPINDGVVEGDETIKVSGSAAGVNVNSHATITLTDDTPGDAATLSIASALSSVAEGDNASFTVTLSHQVNADVTVAWSAPLPADDAEGADLGTTSGSVTFAADSAAGATQTITITITDDDARRDRRVLHRLPGDHNLHPLLAGVR